VHARPCTPETSNPTFPLSRLLPTTVREDTVTSPNGGISLTTCEQAGMHGPTTGRIRSAQQLYSPTTAANIRVRRSHRNSTLLLSPARAGYATRMRQIFEEAGRDQGELQSTSRILYPQLANISRKASPSPPSPPTRSTHESSKYRPESLCLSTNLPSVVASIDETRASLAHQSQHLSGSWSDDSGYILTNNSHTRCSSFTLTPDERIHMWLCELPDWKTINADANWRTELVLEQNSKGTNSQSDQNEMFTFASGQADPFGPDLEEHDRTFTILEHGSLETASGNWNQVGFNPFSRIHTPSSKVRPDPQLWEEGGMQLSPLSPNVCVERGPARYHSNRTLQMGTLYKRGSSILFRAPHLEENVVLKNEGDGSRNSPLTPCSDRANWEHG
jgi:hypothetical protein